MEIDYTLSVADLRKALDRLQPTDRVTCNAVRNLLVLRDGKSIGAIQVRGHLPADEILEEWLDPDPTR